jgi:hypothetical protein
MRHLILIAESYLHLTNRGLSFERSEKSFLAQEKGTERFRLSAEMTVIPDETKSIRGIEIEMLRSNRLTAGLA